MTTRSTRRAAETAVIDAAYNFQNTGQPNPLFAALCELEDLGLDMPDRAAFSNNSTDTSAAAGASLKSIKGMARTCFDEIVLAGGLTVDQLEVLLNGRHQTISARVNQLRDSGWVVDSGMRRATRSGRSAAVWRPTEQALRS